MQERSEKTLVKMALMYLNCRGHFAWATSGIAGADWPEVMLVLGQGPETDGTRSIAGKRCVPGTLVMVDCSGRPLSGTRDALRGEVASRGGAYVSASGVHDLIASGL